MLLHRPFQLDAIADVPLDDFKVRVPAIPEQRQSPIDHRVIHRHLMAQVQEHRRQNRPDVSSATCYENSIHGTEFLLMRLSKPQRCRKHSRIRSTVVQVQAIALRNISTATRRYPGQHDTADSRIMVSGFTSE